MPRLCALALAAAALLLSTPALAEDMDGPGAWGSPAREDPVDADGDGRVSSREFEDAYGERETPAGASADEGAGG